MTRTKHSVAEVSQQAQQTEETIFGHLNRDIFDTANPAPYAEGARRGVD